MNIYNSYLIRQRCQGTRCEPGITNFKQGGLLEITVQSL